MRLTRLRSISGVAIAGMLLLTMVASAAAEPVEGEAFERTWARTDLAVLEGISSRTWMWGPDAISEGFFEPYTEGHNNGRFVQCFVRRCLTYTPGNSPGFEVEAGNIGLHYYIWRDEELPPAYQ